MTDSTKAPDAHAKFFSGAKKPTCKKSLQDGMPEEIWAWVPEILYGEYTASAKKYKPPAIHYRRKSLDDEVIRDLAEALRLHHNTNKLMYGKEYTTSVMWSKTEQALTKHADRIKDTG